MCSCASRCLLCASLSSVCIPMAAIWICSCLHPLDPRLLVGFESFHGSLCASREPGNAVFQSAGRGCCSCRAGLALPAWSGCHQEITFGTVKDAPQWKGRRGADSREPPGSLEGLGFHAWDHPVRSTLSQASRNGAISTLVSLGQGIS